MPDSWLVVILKRRTARLRLSLRRESSSLYLFDSHILGLRLFAVSTLQLADDRL
jgi:hypothetical protein